jgi:hypothetical protein
MFIEGRMLPARSLGIYSARSPTWGMRGAVTTAVGESLFAPLMAFGKQNCGELQLDQLLQDA